MVATYKRVTSFEHLKKVCFDNPALMSSLPDDLSVGQAWPYRSTQQDVALLPTMLQHHSMCFHV